MTNRIQRTRESGFTLLEMSVVLVIIGMILGAISIGKDLQRNAEHKQIKQKFIDQWAIAYNLYYDKTGVVLGDNQVAPTYAVNGNQNDTVHGAFFNHGVMNYKDVEPPLPICQENPAGQFPKDPTSAPAPIKASNTLHQLFDKAGVRMPPGRAEGSEDRYVYLDSNGNPMEIAVCFQWNPPETSSNSGNVMVIYGLTPDLARELDQMIDGKADAREGMFRQAQVVHDEHQVPGIEWASDNTDNFGEAPKMRNRDEDQVNTVVAHYKMNQ